MNGNASHLHTQSIIRIDPSFISRIKFLSVIKRLELISRLLFFAFSLFDRKVPIPLVGTTFINPYTLHRCS